MNDYQQKLADSFRDFITAEILLQPKLVMESDNHFYVQFIMADRDRHPNPEEPSEQYWEPCLRSLAETINKLGKPVTFALLANVRGGMGVRQDNLVSDQVVLRHTLRYTLPRWTRWEDRPEEDAQLPESEFVSEEITPSGIEHTFDVMVLG